MKPSQISGIFIGIVGFLIVGMIGFIVYWKYFRSSGDNGGGGDDNNKNTKLLKIQHNKYFIENDSNEFENITTQENADLFFKDGNEKFQIVRIDNKGNLQSFQLFVHNGTITTKNKGDQATITSINNDQIRVNNKPLSVSENNILKVGDGDNKPKIEVIDTNIELDEAFDKSNYEFPSLTEIKFNNSKFDGNEKFQINEDGSILLNDPDIDVNGCKVLYFSPKDQQLSTSNNIQFPTRFSRLIIDKTSKSKIDFGLITSFEKGSGKIQPQIAYFHDSRDGSINITRKKSDSNIDLILQSGYFVLSTDDRYVSLDNTGDKFQKSSFKNSALFKVDNEKLYDVFRNQVTMKNVSILNNIIQSGNDRLKLNNNKISTNKGEKLFVNYLATGYKFGQESDDYFSDKAFKIIDNSGNRVRKDDNGKLTTNQDDKAIVLKSENNVLKDGNGNKISVTSSLKDLINNYFNQISLSKDQDKTLKISVMEEDNEILLTVPDMSFANAIYSFTVKSNNVKAGYVSPNHIQDNDKFKTEKVKANKDIYVMKVDDQFINYSIDKNDFCLVNSPAIFILHDDKSLSFISTNKYLTYNGNEEHIPNRDRIKKFIEHISNEVRSNRNESKDETNKLDVVCNPDKNFTIDKQNQLQYQGNNVQFHGKSIIMKQLSKELKSIEHDNSFVKIQSNKEVLSFNKDNNIYQWSKESNVQPYQYIFLVRDDQLLQPNTSNGLSICNQKSTDLVNDSQSCNKTIPSYSKLQKANSLNVKTIKYSNSLIVLKSITGFTNSYFGLSKSEDKDVMSTESTVISDDNEDMSSGNGDISKSKDNGFMSTENNTAVISSLSKCVNIKSVSLESFAVNPPSQNPVKISNKMTTLNVEGTNLKFGDDTTKFSITDNRGKKFKISDNKTGKFISYNKSGKFVVDKEGSQFILLPTTLKDHYIICEYDDSTAQGMKAFYRSSGNILDCKPVNLLNKYTKSNFESHLMSITNFSSSDKINAKMIDLLISISDNLSEKQYVLHHNNSDNPGVSTKHIKPSNKDLSNEDNSYNEFLFSIGCLNDDTRVIYTVIKDTKYVLAIRNGENIILTSDTDDDKNTYSIELNNDIEKQFHSKIKIGKHHLVVSDDGKLEIDSSSGNREFYFTQMKRRC